MNTLKRSSRTQAEHTHHAYALSHRALHRLPEFSELQKPPAEGIQLQYASGYNKKMALLSEYRENIHGMHNIYNSAHSSFIHQGEKRHRKTETPT